MKTLKKIGTSKGFTLIEVMVVIAIIAILSSLTAKQVMATRADAKPDEMVDQVSYIAGKMGKCATYKRGVYTGCDFDELVRLGLLEQNQWEDGSGKTPYGGDYSTGAVTGNANQFFITGTGVSTDEHCARLTEVYLQQGTTATCSAGTLTVTYGG